MAEATIQYAGKIADLTLNGIVVKGNTLAHNGTNWVQADASDAATNLYAQYVAMETGASGDVIKGCKQCVLEDADAPFSLNAKHYQSGTVGAITSTRPATNGDVIQVVGQAISTSLLLVDIRPPHELEEFVPISAYDTTGEPGLGIIDSPLWVGPGLDADNEDVYFTGRFPSGVISVDLARVVYNNIAESSIMIAGALITVPDGGTNTGDTGTAFGAATPTSLTTNLISYSDMAAMFDAGALKAGYSFTVAVTASSSANGNLQALYLYMRYTVVD